MIFLWLLRRCRSRRSLQWTFHRYEIHIQYKYSHTLAAITQTHTPTHLFNCMLLSFCVCAFPFCQYHIIPPLSPVSTFNVTIHTQTGVTHWLICLCHAVAVTADILIWPPKMSANYLRTTHHHPPFSPLSYSHW